MKFAADRALTPGSTPQPFLQPPNNVPVAFDPAPHSCDSVISLLRPASQATGTGIRNPFTANIEKLVQFNHKWKRGGGIFYTRIDSDNP